MTPMMWRVLAVLRAGHRVPRALAMPGRVSRMLVRVLVNDRHDHDASDGESHNERREAPTAIRVGRYVTIWILSHLFPRELFHEPGTEFSAPSLPNQPSSRCQINGTDP